MPISPFLDKTVCMSLCTIFSDNIPSGLQHNTTTKLCLAYIDEQKSIELENNKPLLLTLINGIRSLEFSANEAINSDVLCLPLDSDILYICKHIIDISKVLLPTWLEQEKEFDTAPLFSFIKNWLETFKQPTTIELQKKFIALQKLKNKDRIKNHFAARDLANTIIRDQLSLKTYTITLPERLNWAFIDFCDYPWVWYVIQNIEHKWRVLIVKKANGIPYTLFSKNINTVGRVVSSDYTQCTVESYEDALKLSQELAPKKYIAIIDTRGLVSLLHYNKENSARAIQYINNCSLTQPEIVVVELTEAIAETLRLKYLVNSHIVTREIIKSELGIFDNSIRRIDW